MKPPTPPRKARAGRPPAPPPTPPASHPWDTPPRPARGDKDDWETFAGVGQALSQWEYFEGYLGLLYGLLTGDDKATAPGMRAYGAVSAFGTRIDMINEAARAYYFIHGGTGNKAIKDLTDTAKNFATRRNEIAHGIVQPYYIGGVAPTGYALGPSRHATRKQKLRKLDDGSNGVGTVYAYTSEELIYFMHQFDHLANRAMALYRALLIERRKHSASA